MARRHLLSLLGAACLAAMVAEPARAGGFLVSKIGGDRAGPVSGDPAAVFWNPGALGLIEGTRLMLDTNVIYRAAAFVRAVDGRYGGQAAADDLNAQPALAAVSDLGTRDWSFGLGVYAPFGSGSAWSDPHGPQRHHAIWGGIRSVYVTPAVSYRVLDGLHVGLGLSYVRASVVSYRAVDLGAEIAAATGADVPPEQPGNEGRALLDFAGHGASWSLGATWTLDDVVLGASYTSAVDLLLPGELSVYVPRNDFFQGLTGGDVTVDAHLSTTWPDVVRAGAGWQIDERWQVTAALEWARWSRYRAVHVDAAPEQVQGLGDLDQHRVMGWRDTVGLRLGARYRLGDALQLFGGLGGETGAVPDERLDPSVYDALKAGGALGVSWAISERFTWTTSYSHLVYAPAVVRDSAQTPAPTGVHSQQVGILNGNLQVSL